jgi:hypothetical protein
MNHENAKARRNCMRNAPLLAKNACQISVPNIAMNQKS